MNLLQEKSLSSAPITPQGPPSRLQVFFDKILSAISAPLPDVALPIRLMVMLIAYLGCCAIWIKFFNFGDINYGARDWMQERAYFLALTTAVKDCVVPLHMDIAMHGTNRFLAIPETNLAPYIVLLKFIPIGRFILLNQLATFSLGFLGCAVFAERKRLSLIAFAALVLIFNFNGHIVSHLSAGHNWNGYYALPLFFAGVFQVREGKRIGPYCIAAAMFIMTMLGSFHMFALCTVFLLVAAATCRAEWKPFLGALVFSGLLSAGRFLPAGTAASAMTMQWSGGFGTINDLVDALISSRAPGYEAWKSSSCVWPWWEYDTFIGILGVAFIAYFSAGTKEIRAITAVGKFVPAIACIALLSLNYIYAPIAVSHIPIIANERITSRLLVIPVVLLLFLASTGFQRWLESPLATRMLKWLCVLGLAELTGELLWHTSRYTIAENYNVPSDFMMYAAYKGALVQVHDPVYCTSVAVGWAITALAVVVLVVGLTKEFWRDRTRTV